MKLIAILCFACLPVATQERPNPEQLRELQRSFPRLQEKAAALQAIHQLAPNLHIGAFRMVRDGSVVRLSRDVVVWGDPVNVRADGAVYHLDTRELELAGNVRATYISPSGN